ncbi:MAG: bactofilin family protein [Gammaproteobacteria bacterium]
MKAFRRRIQDSASGPTTYIGAESRINGMIVGKGAYVFCGRVEGDCDIEGPATLGEGGYWVGTLKATDVVIAGTVDGDVVADQRVEVAGTARIAGSLTGHSIAVAEGAVIEGEIRIRSGGAATQFVEKRGQAYDEEFVA